MHDPVKADALVVPGGVAWNEVRRVLPLILACKVVPAGSDAPGFYANDDLTELVLKLPIPNLPPGATFGTLTLGHCDPAGTSTFLVVK